MRELFTRDPVRMPHSEPIFFHRGEGGLLWAMQQSAPAIATTLALAVLLLYVFKS